jgi:hypothetical protein
MSESEWTVPSDEPQQNTSNFNRLTRLFLKPRQTMRKITANEKKIWLFPLLMLMVSSLVLTFITASIEKQNIAPIEMPPDMEFYPEEYQDQYSDVMAQNDGFVRTTLFPIIGRWLGLWSNWLILSVLLMVMLLLAGHPLEWREVFNLTAWSTLPLLVRDIIQSIYLLASQQVISQPGLSGFGPVDAQGFTAFLGILLGFVDIYLIWQLLLILAGFKTATQMKGWKSILILLIIAAIFVAVRSLPPYVISRVSSVFSNGMFYF